MRRVLFPGTTTNKELFLSLGQRDRGEDSEENPERVVTWRPFNNDFQISCQTFLLAKHKRRLEEKGTIEEVPVY